MPQYEGTWVLSKQLQSHMPTGTQTGENGNDRIPLVGTLINWRACTWPMERKPVVSSGVARFYEKVGSLNLQPRSVYYCWQLDKTKTKTSLWEANLPRLQADRTPGPPVYNLRSSLIRSSRHMGNWGPESL